MQSDHYTYRLSWSAEDSGFVATCTEFPSLSWLAGDLAGALEGIRHLVAQVVDDMVRSGEAVPQPMSERAFSGKFQVRTTPDLHRRLAIEAAEAGVSMNRLVNFKLSASPNDRSP